MSSDSEKRRRLRGRKTTKKFVMFTKACLNHPNYLGLSPYAVKLLFDIYEQYNGINNGDFHCTWSLMKKRGWKSESTLNKVKKELLKTGWVILTRPGGKNRCALYAVSFQPIDDCKGKLDVKETVTAPDNWKNNNSLLREMEQVTTPPVLKAVK